MLWAVLGALATLWGGVALLLERHGRRRVRGTWDAIVVAGCPARPDGSPSPALARRTHLAVHLLRQGHAPRIVLTGGGGPVTEADAAAGLARQLGVSEDALVLEKRSTSTEENARFAAEMVRGRVLVVSDTYHVWRCERVFRRHFAAVEGAGAAPGAWAGLRLALREVAVVGIYAARGWL